MRRLAVGSSAALLMLALPACSENKDAGAAGDGSGDTSGSETTATTETSSTTTTTTTSTEPIGPVHARGLTVDRIEVSQAVAVPVYKDGAWVGGAGRNAQLVQNRHLMIRAYWVYDEETWEGRDIEAVLTITYADGEKVSAAMTATVDNFAYDGDLARSFWWYLPPENVLTGMKFQVELFETDLGYASEPEPDPLPIYPDKPEWIGIEDSYMVMRAVLVPVEHDNSPDCTSPPPTIDDAVVSAYHDELHEMNPVELVEIEVRDPFVYTGPLTSFGGLLSALSMQRGADGADPGAYYYGIVRACDGGPSDVGGQAIDIPDLPTMGNAWARVSVGRDYGPGGAGTFVHEVGHSQGRRHVACNGDEGGPDPSYPYPGGEIGNWGFGILDWSMYPPTSSRDYMTYCPMAWVSDWGWQQVYPYIQIISSWDMGRAPPKPNGKLLIGSIEPSGQEHWIVVPGAMDDRTATPGHAVELRIGDERRAIPAAISERPHDGTRNVVIELPAPMTQITGVTRVDAKGRYPVPRSTIATHPSQLRTK